MKEGFLFLLTLSADCFYSKIYILHVEFHSNIEKKVDFISPKWAENIQTEKSLLVNEADIPLLIV